MTGLGQHCGYLHWELLGFRRFKLLLWGKKCSRSLPGLGRLNAFSINKPHLCGQWIFKELYKNKRWQSFTLGGKGPIEAAFYVLLSARRATLQKITVLLTQAKTDLQDGVCVKKKSVIHLVFSTTSTTCHAIKCVTEQRNWKDKRWGSTRGHLSMTLLQESFLCWDGYKVQETPLLFFPWWPFYVW